MGRLGTSFLRLAADFHKASLEPCSATHDRYFAYWVKNHAPECEGKCAGGVFPNGEPGVELACHLCINNGSEEGRKRKNFLTGFCNWRHHPLSKLLLFGKWNFVQEFADPWGVLENYDRLPLKFPGVL
jgi:hypothetical protein